MQRFDCVVCTHGRNFETPKLNITVAEAQILMHLHGADCLAKIVPGKIDKTSRFEELDHLRSAYDEEMVDALFPAPSHALPTSFLDIGLTYNKSGDAIVHVSHPDADPKGKDPSEKKRAPAKKKAGENPPRTTSTGEQSSTEEQTATA